MPPHCLSSGMPSVWHPNTAGTPASEWHIPPEKALIPERKHLSVCQPEYTFSLKMCQLQFKKDHKSLTAKKTPLHAALPLHTLSGGCCWPLIRTGRYTSIPIWVGHHKEDNRITHFHRQESSLLPLGPPFSPYENNIRFYKVRWYTGDKCDRRQNTWGQSRQWVKAVYYLCASA